MLQRITKNSSALIASAIYVKAD